MVKHPADRIRGIAPLLLSTGSAKATNPANSQSCSCD